MKNLNLARRRGASRTVRTGFAALVAVALPLPTSWIYRLHAEGSTLLSVALVILSVTPLAVVVTMFRDRRLVPSGATLGAVALATVLPSLVLNHVSEMYAYALLPFWAVLAGDAFAFCNAEFMGKVATALSG